MLTGTINRMWLDLTGEKLKNKGHSTKQQCDEDQQEPDDNHGTNHGGHRHGKQPDALLFKPEDILKMVSQKIQDVKIREKNTVSQICEQNRAMTTRTLCNGQQQPCVYSNGSLQKSPADARILRMRVASILHV